MIKLAIGKLNTEQEPVLTVAAVTSAVSAVLALLVAFGLVLTVAQTAAIMGVVAVVAPLVVVYARKYVTPVVPPKDPNIRA